MSKDISPIKAHAVDHNSHYAKGIKYLSHTKNMQ